MLAEQQYTCPHCWQTSTIQLDLTVRSQVLIQDCAVCCNPIEFRYTVRNGELKSFHYESAAG
jgi:transcription elongation factor Elf1